MTTATATALIYDGPLDPHNDQNLVDALRARLDIGGFEIGIVGMGGGTTALRIALDYDARTLVAERYALVTCNGPEAWMLGFYDDGAAYAESNDAYAIDEGVCVTLTLRSKEPTVEEVVDAVVGILVRTRAVKARAPKLERRRIFWTDENGNERLHGPGVDLQPARDYLARSYSGRPEMQAIVDSVRFEDESEQA